MAQQPQWAKASSYRGSTITLRHTILGRTPLDKWLAWHRDLELTTHNTHKRQTSIALTGFEPKISASKQPQTYALDCTPSWSLWRLRRWEGNIKLGIRKIDDRH